MHELFLKFDKRSIDAAGQAFKVIQELD